MPHWSLVVSTYPGRGPVFFLLPLPPAFAAELVYAFFFSDYSLYISSSEQLGSPPSSFYGLASQAVIFEKSGARSFSAFYAICLVDIPRCSERRIISSSVSF